MRRIRLERGDGRKVNEIDIPAEGYWPEVVVCKGRVFRLHCIHRNGRIDYREVTAYFVPERTHAAAPQA